MTKADVFIQIISEVTGAPRQEVSDLHSNIMKAHPDQNWDKIIPDNEIDELFKGLRAEAPGILAWLMKGAMQVDSHESGSCH